MVDNVYQTLLCTEHCATCRGAERKATAILLWRIQLYASVNIIGNVVRLQKFLVFGNPGRLHKNALVLLVWVDFVGF